jgi:hypothetical protein
MSDNTTINPGAGGDVIGTDDVGGVKYQRIKAGFGADGSYGDVSSANPLPTSVASSATVGCGRASVTTPGTEVQLASQTCSSITVKARATNVNTVYVGGSAVTAANGFELSPGEPISMDVSNANAVWIDAATGGDGITYLWVA